MHQTVNLTTRVYGGSNPSLTTMRESEVTFDDRQSRNEARKLWRDVGSLTNLNDGPHKGVDLTTEDYNIELGRSSIPHDDRLYKFKELRIEKRKLRYWTDTDKPCHYLIFNKEFNDAMLFSNSQVRKWIEKYPIEYRYCKGWNRENCYFLIIPPTEKIRRFKKEKTWDIPEEMSWCESS